VTNGGGADGASASWGTGRARLSRPVSRIHSGQMIATPARAPNYRPHQHPCFPQVRVGHVMGLRATCVVDHRNRIIGLAGDLFDRCEDTLTVSEPYWVSNREIISSGTATSTPNPLTASGASGACVRTGRRGLTVCHVVGFDFTSFAENRGGGLRVRVTAPHPGYPEPVVASRDKTTAQLVSLFVSSANLFIFLLLVVTCVRYASMYVLAAA